MFRFVLLPLEAALEFNGVPFAERRIAMDDVASEVRLSFSDTYYRLKKKAVPGMKVAR